MPKTTGISRFVCDRTSCNKEEYLAESDTKSKQWMEVERTNADRVKDTALLCPECYTKYKTLVGSQDTEYNKFMRGDI